MDESSNTVKEKSEIYLLRHGDRHDFANPEWKEKIEACKGLRSDPPLSKLGHEQARETAKKIFHNVDVDEILVSPYLRTIQTAVPLSEAKQVPISIETGLAEAWHCPNLLPTAAERYKYFPHINFLYNSLHDTVPTEGAIHPAYGIPQERFPDKYFERIVEFAKKLEAYSVGKTIVCFSHAASVALVAALLKCRLPDIPFDSNCKDIVSEKYGKSRYDLFAPVGIYKLKREDSNSSWVLESNGSTNTHCSKTSPGTYPWGHREGDYKQWEAALTL